MKREVWAFTWDWPPYSTAGAYLTTHDWLTLLSESVKVRVVNGSGRRTGKSSDMLSVTAFSDYKHYQAGYNPPAVVIAHADSPAAAASCAREHNSKLVLLAHNVGMKTAQEIEHYKPDAVVYVSQFCRRRIEAMMSPSAVPTLSFVCRPMVTAPSDWTPELDGKPVALSANMSIGKGGEFVVALAKRMTDWKFVGYPGWGDLNIEALSDAPGNMDVRPPIGHGEMMRVLEHATVNLMPGPVVDSWGRIVAESCALGVPTVTTDKQHGVREVMGDSGIVAPRDLDSWELALRTMHEDRKARQNARDRGLMLSKITHEDAVRLVGTIKVIGGMA